MKSWLRQAIVHNNARKKNEGKGLSRPVRSKLQSLLLWIQLLLVLLSNIFQQMLLRAQERRDLHQRHQEPMSSILQECCPYRRAELVQPHYLKWQ